MIKVVAELYKVTLQYNWQYERAEDGTLIKDETSTWHCASLNGAHEFIQKKIERGDVSWYSIQGEQFIPCDEDNPDGLLYIGVTHFEFHEFDAEGNMIA